MTQEEADAILRVCGVEIITDNNGDIYYSYRNNTVCAYEYVALATNREVAVNRMRSYVNRYLRR